MDNRMEIVISISNHEKVNVWSGCHKISRLVKSVPDIYVNMSIKIYFLINTMVNLCVNNSNVFALFLLVYNKSHRKTLWHNTFYHGKYLVNYAFSGLNYIEFCCCQLLQDNVVIHNNRREIPEYLSILSDRICVFITDAFTIFRSKDLVLLVWWPQFWFVQMAKQ